MKRREQWTKRDLDDVRRIWKAEYNFEAPDAFIRKHLDYTSELDHINAETGELIIDLYTLLTAPRFADSPVAQVARRLGMIKRLERRTEGRTSASVLASLTGEGDEPNQRDRPG